MLKRRRAEGSPHCCATLSSRWLRLQWWHLELVSEEVYSSVELLASHTLGGGGGGGGSRLVVALAAV